MNKWLDKYEQGGMVLKQKTEDNYGKKPNVNNVQVSAPPGFVGMGSNIEGRDYSPAWGGQFQTGGFLQPTSDKLPEGYVIPYNTPSTELSMSIGGEDGEPAYLIPSFKGGRKLKDPIAEYKKTGEHLGGPFKTWQEAEKFGEMRHKYVEKGQDIPSPIKTWGDMAMGGSLPGSVGFTYARTIDPAPSEGKYAKKTLPSAQDGIKEFYSQYLQSPKYKQRLSSEGYSNVNTVINDRLKNLSKSKIKSGPESYYDPIESTAFINQKDAKTYNTPISSITAHELSHAAGSLGRTDYFNPENLGLSDFAINQINKRNNLSGYINDYVKKKVPLNTEKMHDGKPSEFKADMDMLRYRLFNDKMYDAGKQDFNQDMLNKAKQKYKGDKEVERLFNRAKDSDLIFLMNNIAKNNFEINQTDNIAQNGQEMSFYQNGLDFKTKGMKNGGWLDAYDVPQAQEGDVFPKREQPTPASESTSIMRNIPGEGVSTTATTGQRKEDVKLDADAMKRFKAAETKDKQKRIAERKSAIAAKDKGKPFTLPTGETKSYDDMDWREKAYVSGKSLESKGRANENDEALYDDINPISWITNIAGGLATAPYEARESNSNMPYVGAVLNPLVQGALGFDPLGGAMKVPGKIAQSIESGVLSNTHKLNPWAENLNDPLKSYRVAGMDAARDFENTGVLRSVTPPTPEGASLLERAQNRPTSFPSFQKGYADMRYLPEEGGVVFETGLPTYKRGEINPVTGNAIRGRHYAHRVIDPTTGSTLSEIPGENIRMFGDKPHWLKGYKEVPKPSTAINKSGFNEESINLLGNISSRTRNKISKMSEDDFKESVFKPTGEVVPYKKGTSIDEMTFDPYTHKLKLKDAEPISVDDYTKKFNDNIDVLNKIIAKKNKSGRKYSVERLDPNGRLTFKTEEFKAPEQTVSDQIDINNFLKDPIDFLNKKNSPMVQNAEGKWTNREVNGLFDSPEDIISLMKQTIEKGLEPRMISGNTFWDLDINPGKWKGKVKDVANSEYYRSIPGLDMKNTTKGVFNTGISKRGTRTYESINEYLKKLDLGRVKPGFNNQTDFSFGLWDNAVKKGKAFGHYSSKGSIHGAMRKEGGVVKDDMGYWNPDNHGKVVEIGSNNITMEGVDQPLIGISDEGDQQYMLPGKNYKFKGKKVREYPVAKNGVRQEQKGLQNLDDLTNFTNYNIPKAQDGDVMGKGKLQTRSGETMTFDQASQILKTSLSPMVAEKINYIKSPLYKERLVGMGEKDPNKVIADRIQGLRKIKFSSYDPRMNVNLKESEPSQTKQLWKSDKEGKAISSYPSVSLGVGWKPSSAAHEIGHVTSSLIDNFVPTVNTGTGETMSPKEAREFLDLSKLKPEFKKGAIDLYNAQVRNQLSNPYGAIYDTDLGATYGRAKKIDEHSIGSGEAKGDLDAVRYLFKQHGLTKKYGENITPETLKKAQENKKIQGDEFFKRLKKRFSDEDIIKLNNEIAQNNVNPQESSYAKLGTKLKTKGWLDKY